jgi:hypothetical protein
MIRMNNVMEEGGWKRDDGGWKRTEEDGGLRAEDRCQVSGVRGRRTEDG